MQRLQSSKLIWGNLHPVDEPHLVERYAKAMRAFGLTMPDLERFEIDMTGWSKDVADALGDRDYMNPGGVNRRFIILSPFQARLPVVHTSFSNTNELMAEFFRENARVINALTIRDVIYGEIEDTIAEVRSMEDLLAIEEVRFRVLSADDTVRKAAELRTLADRLKTEPDAWRDDAMIGRMVDLAGDTGDIRRKDLVPDRLVFRHETFWSSHFGGVYVFHDEDRITVIGDPEAPGFRRSRPWQVSYIDINDADRVFNFLAQSERLELPRDSWIDPSGYLVHRSAMLLRDLIARLSPRTDLNALTDRDVRVFLREHADAVKEDGTLPFLSRARREIEDRGVLDANAVSDGHRRFILVRARPDHADRWLVNQLITEFVPFDFVTNFVFHKPLFYKRYETRPDAWREHVVRTIENTYVRDKREFRARLYGFE